MRFGLVGVINTSIDFGLLFILHFVGLPIVVANIISSTVAFCFSFIANKKVTFQTEGTNIKREITLFIVVTLFGLWVIQSLVILLVQFALEPLIDNPSITLGIAKLIATGITLVWNYLLYDRVVFKRHD